MCSENDSLFHNSFSGLFLVKKPPESHNRAKAKKIDRRGWWKNRIFRRVGPSHEKMGGNK